MKISAALILVSLAMTPALHADTTWIAGRNYKVLQSPLPTHVSAGQVEVIEVFSYTCGYCYALEPQLEEWLKSKPDYVHFTRLSAVWDPWRESLTRLHYAIEQLNRPDVVQAVFAALQKHRHTFSANSETDRYQQYLQFVGALGVSSSAFENAWNSPSVLSRVKQTKDLMISYQIEETPTIVINGRYTITARQVQTVATKDVREQFRPLLEATTFLAEKEHQAMLSAAAKPVSSVGH